MTDATWIGETFVSDVGWDHLERLVDIGSRMAGSPGEAEATVATGEAFERVGCRDVRVDRFPIQGWERGATTLGPVDGPEQVAVALPRSPAGATTGRLVDVGHGLPDDFDRDLSGAVVVAASDVPDHFDRFVHRREKYYRAVDADAAAFVFRNHVPGGLAPTGSVGDPDEPIGPIPAVGVSREVGARLRRRFDGDEVTVRVECATPDAESGNVHAEVGPDTDAEVLVTCHVDAHDVAEGAMDNGAGVATVLEVARILAARADALDTRVRFVAFGAEEVGLVGSTQEADGLGDDREAVRAVVNVDSNVAGRTLRVHTHGFDGLDAAVEAVGERFDHPIASVPTVVPHSDHWPFVRHGVPAVMVSAETEGCGRGWGHTAADTIDKLERRTLREQAILVAALVVDLASDGRADDLAHADPTRIASALEAQGDADGMRYTGDWPF